MPTRDLNVDPTTAALLDASEDVFWLFTRDCEELRLVNDAYEPTFGRPVDRLREEPEDFLAGVHPEDRGEVMAAMDRLSGGEPVELEYRVNPDEDYERWLWVKGEPVPGPDGEEWVGGFCRDTTERRTDRERLKRQNERLDTFTTVVSHDLRNPLNVAQLNLDLLAREHDLSDDEYVSRATDALDRIETLVDDLLVLARHRDRESAPEPVELAAAARDRWETTATGAATLTVEDSRTVEADPTQLAQLLGNLFDNAVTHGGADVEVRVGVTDEGFYVADDGSGLSAPESEVFQAGYTSADDGSGFGLSIVQRVAATRDWTVSAGASADGGARFDIAT